MTQQTIEHSSSRFVKVNAQQQAILCDILPKLCPLDTEQLDKLSTSYLVYNAVYDLAEVLYLQGVSSNHEQTFMQILQMGRISVVQLTSADVSSDENSINHQNILLSDDDILTQEIALVDETPICVDEPVLMDNISSLPTSIRLNTDEFEQTKLSLEKADEHLTPIVPVMYANHENQNMSFFQMSQNARVGLPYQGKIILHSPISQEIQIVASSVKFSHDIGLYFDEQFQEVCGQPSQVVDDFYLEFKYTLSQSTQEQSAKVYLTINPNPRDIWQELEPASDLPYAKSHTAHQHLAHEWYDIYAIRCRGRTHAHTGTYCDDDFFVQTLAESQWSVLVVSDGAGSAKFSRQGSKIAVNIVGEYLLKYVQHHHADLEQLLSQWQIGQADEQTRLSAHQLYNKFNQQFYDASQEALKCIELEAEHQQAKMRDFASTLLVAVTKHDAKNTFVASFAVGDGAICAYHTERNVVLMNEPDAGEHAGQTQFLDDIHKTQKQRTHVRYLQGHYHVMLMTDGISDPIFASDAELQSAEHWHQFWQKDIVPQLQHEQPSQALLTWSNFYSDGHHDDRTLIVLHAKPPLPTPNLASGTSLSPHIDTCTTIHHHQE